MMVDISSIGAALSAFKGLKDTAQAMIALRDAAAFQEKMLEFQGRLMDAQSAVFAANEERSALIDAVGELKKQVARLEAWEAEKQRYDLVEVVRGRFVYRLKVAMQNGEPTHDICAACYQRGQKTILQTQAIYSGRCTVLTCDVCGTDLYTEGEWDETHAKRRGGRSLR